MDPVLKEIYIYIYIYFFLHFLFEVPLPVPNLPPGGTSVHFSFPSWEVTLQGDRIIAPLISRVQGPAKSRTAHLSEEFSKITLTLEPSLQACFCCPFFVSSSVLPLADVCCLDFSPPALSPRAPLSSAPILPLLASLSPLLTCSFFFFL